MWRPMTKPMVDRMYALMKAKGISTNHMCKLIGVEYPAFLAALNGKQPFFGKWQKKVAEELGVDRFELFHEFYDNVK